MNPEVKFLVEIIIVVHHKQRVRYNSAHKQSGGSHRVLWFGAPLHSVVLRILLQLMEF